MAAISDDWEVNQRIWKETRAQQAKEIASTVCSIDGNPKNSGQLFCDVCCRKITRGAMNEAHYPPGYDRARDWLVNLRREERQGEDRPNGMVQEVRADRKQRKAMRDMQDAMAEI